MPKLLRSSETVGCGATIELDSGQVVVVSIAQTGVLIRLLSSKEGPLKRIMSSFFGPQLYNEKVVYKNAQTARALDILFPEPIPELNFNNPGLRVFASAVWHCASAAEVSTMLNAAVARVEGMLSGAPAASASDATRASRISIISDFGELMEKNPPLPTRIEDVSVLPYPKEVILDALLAEIEHGHHPQHLHEMMKIGALSLPYYQPGVGQEPLEKLGMDVSKLPRTTDLEELRTQAKLMVEAQGRTGPRFDEFNGLVEEDSRRISAKIVAAENARR